MLKTFSEGSCQIVGEFKINKQNSLGETETWQILSAKSSDAECPANRRESQQTSACYHGHSMNRKITSSF